MVKNYFLGDGASFSLFYIFLTLPPGVQNISFAGNYNRARFHYFWASFRKESNLEVKGGCGKMIKGIWAWKQTKTNRLRCFLPHPHAQWYGSKLFAQKYQISITNSCSLWPLCPTLTAKAIFFNESIIVIFWLISGRSQRKLRRRHFKRLHRLHLGPENWKAERWVFS